MVDTDGFNSIEKAAAETKQAVDRKEWSRATELWRYTSYIILNATENIDFYNILYKTSVKHTKLLIDPGLSTPGERSGDKRDSPLHKLMNSNVKKRLGLNVTWGDQSNKVFSILSEDFMKPVTNTGAYRRNHRRNL